MSEHRVELEVNGAVRSGVCEARTTLADFLREELGLTGTHLGCEHGVCGACTVILDGAAVRSCLIFAIQAAGHDVTTVEGLGRPDAMHPVQQAFYEAMSFQCGFCTPGFITTTVAFLAERATAGERGALDDAQIREMLGGNLCRCTGYQSIVDGVRLAIERADAVAAPAAEAGAPAEEPSRTEGAS